MAGFTLSNDGDVSGNNGLYDFWVFKIEQNGTLQWQKILGGSLNDEGSSVRQNTDGSYLMAGRSGSSDGDVTGNIGGPDFWVVKLNPSGNLLWQKSLGGGADDIAESILLTPDGGFMLMGSTGSSDGDVTGNHGFFDYWVVKLSPNLGVTDFDQTINLVLYPNPAKEQLNVVADVPFISGRISDALGRWIETFEFSNDFTNVLDISGLKTGFYFLEVQTNENTKTVKSFIKN